MLVAWSDKYSVEYERVDKQHKKLFELANKAYDMGTHNTSKEEIKSVLDGFFNYMKVHFKDEEDYMTLIGYPLIENHKKIHREIIKSLVTLIKEIHDLNDMRLKLSIIAKKWLLEHILHEDMKIANWKKEMILQGKDLNLEQEQINFYYVCDCQHKVHKFNKLTHEKIQEGSKYRCKVCNKIVTYQKH